MPFGTVSYSGGNPQAVAKGDNTTSVAAGTATNTVIKNSPGRLCRVLITQAGTAPLVIYDNASDPSGTIIGYVEANAAAGTIREFDMPALNGITVAGNAANPGFTVSWD